MVKSAAASSDDQHSKNSEARKVELLNSPSVVEHGGDTATHHARLLMVPDSNFAFVLLTNANGGSALRKRLTPWILEYFLEAARTITAKRLRSRRVVSTSTLEPLARAARSTT
jgi:hypothetical protein